MVKHELSEVMQSAYRPGHSIETALLKVQNDILMSIDDKKMVLLVLLDLSTAFDTVSHDILLERLENRIGVKGCALAWFRSYLLSRKQKVRCQTVESSVQNLKCGVPQGSVLGPILFCIYTTPVGDIIRQHGVSFHQYADDTQLYVAFDPTSQHSVETADVTMESCISHLRSWMVQNMLKFNDNKTEVIVVRSPYLHRAPDLPVLQVGNVSVTAKTDAVRNLGAQFDCNLLMGQHINSICKSAYYHYRTYQKVLIKTKFGTSCTRIYYISA